MVVVNPLLVPLLALFFFAARHDRAPSNKKPGLLARTGSFRRFSGIFNAPASCTSNRRSWKTTAVPPGPSNRALVCHRIGHQPGHGLRLRIAELTQTVDHTSAVRIHPVLADLPLACQS